MKHELVVTCDEQGCLVTAVYTADHERWTVGKARKEGWMIETLDFTTANMSIKPIMLSLCPKHAAEYPF